MSDPQQFRWSMVARMVIVVVMVCAMVIGGMSLMAYRSDGKAKAAELGECLRAQLGNC